MTEEQFLSALRRAMGSANPAWRSQPSHLRRRLDEELGDASRGERARIHQVIVAVEEQIPVRLERGGWTPALHDDLVETLVRVRGWTPEASDRAVTTWAEALDLDPSPRVPGFDDDASARPVGPAGEGTILPSMTDAEPTVLPSEMSGQFASGKGSSADPGAQVLPMEASATTTSSDAPAGSSSHRGVSENNRPPSSAAAEQQRRLPQAGTRRPTKLASKLLDCDIEVAYEVLTGPNPVWLFTVFPISVLLVAIVAFGVFPVLPVLLLIVVGRVLSPKRVIAVSGGNVWLLASGRGFVARPKSLICETTRDDIDFAGGWPFTSVRLAGERLWFLFPTTRAAGMLAGSESEP